MDCNQARTGLWPPERPRLVGGDVAAAHAHVRDCEDCTAYFEQDRALLDLYDRARRTPAPLPVRERVFDALAGARWDTLQKTSKSDQLGRHTEGGGPVNMGQARVGTASQAIRRAVTRFGAWAAAISLTAAAAVAVIVVESRPMSPGSAESPDMFVQDYLRRAVGEHHIETSDPAEVTRFLQRELGLRVQALQVAGLDLTSVEICLLEGRRGAMITYELDGAIISHYVVPREGASARAPAVAEHVSGGGSTDMPVVTWATLRIEQALVGEVDADHLLEIVARGSSE